MAVHYVKGNLLEADVDYICHQVNCQGKMGSGIAKSIREKWPIVHKEYLERYHWFVEKAAEFNQFEDGITPSEMMLGTCNFTKVNDKQTVVNLAAQEYYGYDGKQYTSYDAFWFCLNVLKIELPKGSRIGFPDHIGCCRGGANWEIIRTMIDKALGKDYEVYIYKLED